MVVCWDMFSKRVFGFGYLLTKLTLVAWVRNVSGFNVLSEVGFFAALIWTVKTIPELSILVHFTLYFSFKIYKQQSIYGLCWQCLDTCFLQVSLVLKVLLQFSQRYPEWATCRASTCSYKCDFLPVWYEQSTQYHMFPSLDILECISLSTSTTQIIFSIRLELDIF